MKAGSLMQFYFTENIIESNYDRFQKLFFKTLFAYYEIAIILYEYESIEVTLVVIFIFDSKNYNFLNAYEII